MKVWNLAETFVILVIVGLMSLVANSIPGKVGIAEAIPGLLILIAIAIVGILMAKFLPGHVPAAAYVTTLGCILTIPGFPGSEILGMYVKKVGFLALCTPILAYAGVSIGKDMDAFKNTGWRIVILSCAIFIGTYIGSAVIAQVILKAMGQI